MIDMHTIGAGGGSIAWLDIAQGLHVGPQSAGAFPGPACYMRGGRQPTVTDADLILGYLSPDGFLGGDMKISPAKAKEALQRISRPLKMPLVEAADGIFQIVNSNMANGIRVVTVEKGFDPRDFKLIVFGGAGPVHVPALAGELGIRHMVVPRDASVFSAFGLVVSDMRHHFVKNIDKGMEALDSDEIRWSFDELRHKGEALLGSWGVKKKDICFELLCDMKFPGQYRELTVPVPANISSARKVSSIFKELHDKLYGFVEDQVPKIINIRVNAIGKIQKPRLIKRKPAGPDSRKALKTSRDVFFHEKGGYTATPVYDGQKINPGSRLRGPAVIELPTTTIVVRPGQSVYMDAYYNFNIDCPAKSHAANSR
jgi:N-methylhydantoinase A